MAFFDFGMIRRLPEDYLRREAVIARGVREGDNDSVISGMRALGYLPGGLEEWGSELLLEYMRQVSWWLQAEGPLRLTPEDLWRAADVLREADARRHIDQLRRTKLPPEALLLRLMEGLLFQTAAMMRASGPWGELLRELIEEDEPVGELGAQHAAWLARHHNRRLGRRFAAA